jgi:hypothetical protein
MPGPRMRVAQPGNRPALYLPPDAGLCIGSDSDYPASAPVAARAAARAAVTLTGPRRCMTGQLPSRLATSAPRSKRTTQAASCAVRIAAACAASTRSGRL